MSVIVRCYRVLFDVGPDKGLDVSLDAPDFAKAFDDVRIRSEVQLHFNLFRVGLIVPGLHFWRWLAHLRFGSPFLFDFDIRLIASALADGHMIA